MIDMEMHRDARGFPGAGSGASVTPHNKSQLKMTSDSFLEPAEQTTGASDYGSDFYRVHLFDTESGLKPMRKVDETWARSSERGTYMTHHVFVDSDGRKWRVPWRDFLHLAQQGGVRKAHLRTARAMDIAQSVAAGKIGWPEALSRLERMDPAEYRPGDSVPETNVSLEASPAAGEAGQHE